MDAFWSIVAFLTIVGIAIFGLIGQRPVNKIVAYLALNPEALTKVHRAIGDHWLDHDFGDKPDEVIEAEAVEDTKHLVGRTFAAIYRDQPFGVIAEKRFDPAVEWPKVRAIVTDQNILVLSVDLGKSLMGRHARMKAITVRIRRHGVIKLDTRRPIAEAFQEPYTPPAKVASAKAAPVAKPSPAPAKAQPAPVSKPVSAHVQKQRKLP